jgi:2-alkyl-3-oxoalkanoate reductase
MEHHGIRVGIVGAGYVSAYHIRAIQSLGFAQVVGIADPDQDRAQEIASKFGIPAVYPSLDKMGEAGPDVVHILTPPSLHCRLAVEAMRMGANVLVEKPMAETVAECDEMIAVAKETGRVLSVNHSARMDPVVLEALEMVRQGVCGDVLAVDFFRNSDYTAYAGGPLPPPYRKGSYPFQDLGVHGFYLLEAFLGPIRSADVRYYGPKGDPVLFFDEWRALVECERGAGQMYISWNAKPMQNELVIHGTRATLSVDCYLQMLRLDKTYPAPKPIQRMLGLGLNALSTLVKVPLNAVRFVTGKLAPNPGIQVSVQKFYEALRDEKAPPVSPEEGRRMIACLAAVSEKADAEKEARLRVKPARIQPRILVTGSAGFLGSAVLKRLQERGEPLRVLLRKPLTAPPEDEKLHVMYGDLGDPQAVDKAVEGVEVVYHVGAAMKGGEAEFQRGTVWGTRNVVEACLRHGVKRLIHVSSLSVYDHAGHRPGVPVTEAHPYEPHPSWRGYYTQTKLDAEKIVLNAMKEKGLPAVILRPGQIFGPAAAKFPPSGTIGLGGRWLVVGSGNLPVPLVYVDDVADALLLAEERQEATGEVIQLVDPTRVTQKEYVAYAKKKLGQTISVSYVSPTLLKLAAFGVEQLGKILKRSVPLSRYRVESIRPLWPCDVTAAQNKLGWTPRVGTREGLRRTYEI